MDELATDPGAAAPRPWSPSARTTAAVGWSAFLAACLGTVLLFAVLDPRLIIDCQDRFAPGEEPFWLTPTGIYSGGFFLLWLVAAAGAGMAVFLARSERP
jgi:hypothetical protein